MSHNNKQILQTPDEISNVKPLTDDDVILRRKRMANADGDKLNNIFKSFSNNIKSIITLAEKYVKDEDDEVALDSIKRIIKLCPDDEILIRTMDKIWGVRLQIINKDINYFLNKEYGNLVREDEKKEMIVGLIQIVREFFPELKKEEQNVFWSYGTSLLKLVAECKKLIGEQ